MTHIFLHVLVFFYYLLCSLGIFLVVRGIAYHKILSLITGGLLIWNSCYMLNEFFNVAKELMK